MRDGFVKGLIDVIREYIIVTFAMTLDHHKEETEQLSKVWPTREVLKNLWQRNCWINKSSNVTVAIIFKF